MITGKVRRNEARVSLNVYGTHGRKEEIDAVVDTGYTSWLSLPPDLVASLGLSWQGLDRAVLADGRIVSFDVYDAEIVWDGKTRKILVDEADTDPLVGMALLKGYEFKMQVRAGGKIVIKRLPKRPQTKEQP